MAGHHRLTIKNGSCSESIVKLRDAATRRLVVSFFASRAQIAVLDGIPDGSYVIQFAFGEAMSADCRQFLAPHAQEFKDVQTFATHRTPTEISTQELSFTLYAVPGGNVTPSDISAAEFLED